LVCDYFMLVHVLNSFVSIYIYIYIYVYATKCFGNYMSLVTSATTDKCTSILSVYILCTCVFLFVCVRVCVRTRTPISKWQVRLSCGTRIFFSSSRDIFFLQFRLILPCLCQNCFFIYKFRK
jgi:hypothetical protein